MQNWITAIQEKNAIERLRYLEDNADDIREGSFYREFSEAELEDLRLVNAQADIEIRNLEETLKRLTDPLKTEPKEYSFSSNIHAVTEWLSTKNKTTDIAHAAVLVSYKDGRIVLKLNIGQENQRISSNIHATLFPNPLLEAFKINKGYAWDLTSLANFLKFNRRFFPSPSANLDLVSGLKAFRANVTREIEKASDDRGNHRRLDDKRVHTDLPETFTLQMPIFEGEDPQDFDVEILIEEKEGTVRATLQSVSLLEKTEKYIRQAIEEELITIKKTGITIIVID